MDTGQEFEPLQLKSIQCIPPAPNSTITAIDWIPDFVGFGWVAYGAGPFVVITTTQLPEGEEEPIGPFFQQILQPLQYEKDRMNDNDDDDEEYDEDEDEIRAVAWAPVIPSNGLLAVGAGEFVYVYEPRSLVVGNANSVPELPLAWRQDKALSHSSRVNVVVWTESGDGLLAAGLDVIMWARGDSGWVPLWKSNLKQPHFLASATWSSVGFTATAADGSTCARCPWSMTQTPASFRGTSKGQVIVWHWNEVSSLQEIELSHPQPVSMIQWRPSNFACFQREVLLTCCLDGAVRLWMEIDNGRAKLDKRHMREMSDKHTRATFFVSAIIEVNQCLNGILGTDISVMWTRETGGASIQSRDRFEVSSFDEVSKGSNVGSCEWLLGIGPNASLAWWSLHCLDDISPPRYPRVSLWKKGTDLLPQRLKLPLVGSYLNSNACSVLLKAFIQRIGRKSSAPPSSVDLFELLPQNIFSWSRVEASMSISSLGSSLEENINSNEESLRNPHVSSEILNQGGHSGTILQVELHPVIEAELAASLDSNGIVLIWSLNSLVEPQIEIPTFIHPAWKLSYRLPRCEISEQIKYRFLTWAPLFLKESQSLLFVGHSQGFDCIFIQKESIIRKTTTQHEMACAIQFPESSSQQLKSIYATLLSATSTKDFIKYNVLVLGLGKRGQIVQSWKILLHVQHEGEIPLEQLSEYFLKKGIALDRNCTNEFNLAKKGYYISVEPCLPKFVNSIALVQVTSIAVTPTGNHFSFCQQSVDDLYGAGYNIPAYNFATCHSDGVLKLWKVSVPQESLVPNCQTVEISWNCVGLIKIPKGTGRLIALANSGCKIATASSIASEDTTTINIWDAESYLGDCNFVLEDIIHFPGCVTALDWLAIGNGQFLLGVAMQNEVRVYSQRRHVSDTSTTQGDTANLHIWFCIASICTTSYIRALSWGPKATLLLVSSELVYIVSQWAYTADRKVQEFKGQNSALVNLCSLHSQSWNSLKDNNEASLTLSTNGNGNKCLSMALGDVIEHYLQHVQGSIFSLLEIADEIGGPLPVYHPSAVLHCLLIGNRKRAVASMRHLMAYVGAEISHKESNEPQKPFLCIPQVDLSKFLQVGLAERNHGRELQWGVGTGSAISTTNAWTQTGASHANTGSWFMGEQKSIGKDCDDLFSKIEVESFITALEKCPKIHGVTDGERIQLFALLDLLAEISSSHEAAQYENLDEPAQRFWMLVHFRRLYFMRKMGRPATVEELTVESRTQAWACQSDCQDVLLDLCLSDELSWPALRSLGVGFWFTNVTSLRSRMEKLARAQYLKRKDPKDCALLYMALNRRNVLLGLFKLSRDEKDKPLVGFLARNFEEEKNKAAALKNAYVLKGRHQFELAVTFFLLGDDPSSAVSVCAKNLGDEQLALVISCLVEGSNGPLAMDLISNHILPIAEGRKDYWLASMLQWLLGNPMKSLLQLIQPSAAFMSREQSMQVDNLLAGSANSADTACFDSNIGQYCATLAMKNSVKGSIGESNATSLARWAIMKTSSALKRSGFPVEALECLSASTNFLLKESFKELSVIENHEDPLGKYEPNKKEEIQINWISRSLAGKMESTYKLNLAVQYMSKLVIAYPQWGFMDPFSCKLMLDIGTENKEESQYLLLVKELDQKLSTSLSVIEQRYFIQITDVIQELANFCYHHGRHFFWCRLLHASVYPRFPNAFQISKSFTMFPFETELLQKATRQTFNVLTSVVQACGYNMSSLKEVIININVLGDSESDFHHWFLNLRELLYISYDIKLLTHFVINEGLHSEEQHKIFKIIDLLTLVICVALAWLRRDARALLALIKTTMLHDKDNSSEKYKMEERHQQLYSLADHAQQYPMLNSVAKALNSNQQQENSKHEKSNLRLIRNHSRWQLVGVCLWGRLMSSINEQLHEVSSRDGSYSGSVIKRLLLSTLESISAGLIRQFAWYLRQTLHTMPSNPILLWLSNMDTFVKMEAQNRALDTLDDHGALEFENDNINFSQRGIDDLVTPENISDVSLKEVSEILVIQKDLFFLLKSKGFTEFECRNKEGVSHWSRLAKEFYVEDSVETSMADIQRAVGFNTANGLRRMPVGSTAKSLTSHDQIVLGTEQKMAFRKEKMSKSFQKPKEVLRRNGELLEAICVNSCNPEQVVVASNRKGLIYLNLTTVEPYFDSLEYVWSSAEWPRNGWAGSESTPVPTFVSPGLGLGSKEGSSLGLGGATVGLGSLPRSGKDLNGVTFGIPGYAGIGAMGLGWGEWEDFEGFIDPPATAENVSTRALASHPLRPLFLVGSSNTHVYLWEFGKATAIATYGVLPAANIPPPYPLASVSALQFDCYGQRFTTAAMDGTVCAWQLERCSFCWSKWIYSCCNRPQFKWSQYGHMGHTSSSSNFSCFSCMP
ncbi:uncharacterized protein LOC131050818 isoform X2 [Cryptomeria japonica]|uniref:uncharacterized protein LOC131050818 isoform X2 n=1 Tax=Cryptomeria japonica TaxID=3369 RepID=UPI0027D9E4E8|nr:uncharacterized protein LOC131050818 isoform X2 [Cryptomeria japonica]